jgi:hypothetical protein
MSARGAAPRPVVSFTFEMPPAADSQFLFRRAFLAAIRKAISEAHIRGEISAAIAVECNRALPAEPMP